MAARNPTANNYDETATLNDGSCTYGMPTAGQLIRCQSDLCFRLQLRRPMVNPCDGDILCGVPRLYGCLGVQLCDPDATLPTTCFYPADLCGGATNVDCDCGCWERHQRQRHLLESEMVEAAADADPTQL